MLNGWLIINKPAGISSAKVVYIIKKIFSAHKVGHAGTLDPFATGVLPISLGEATKTSSYILNSSKKYIFTLKFGTQTSTDDVEGDIIKTSTNLPTKEEIISVIPKFLGQIEQIPPIYSAIKLQGKPAYARARAGEEFEMSVRSVHIDNLRLLSFVGNEAIFSIACGSGTYVRSLGRDLALSLNTVGHLIQLQRTLVANFSIENSIELETLKNLNIEELNSLILPLGAAISHLQKIIIDFETARRLSFGQKIKMEIEDADIISLWHAEQLVAIASIKNCVCKSLRVFNYLV